jgi:hypothetical protein
MNAHLGPAAMIPGAFEVRSVSPAAAPTAPDVPITLHPQDVVESDRGRLELEREGGGAPNQRAGVRRGTVISRLWLTALHPTQLSDIWRRLPTRAA